MSLKHPRAPGTKADCAGGVREEAACRSHCPFSRTALHHMEFSLSFWFLQQQKRAVGKTSPSPALWGTLGEPGLWSPSTEFTGISGPSQWECTWHLDREPVLPQSVDQNWPSPNQGIQYTLRPDSGTQTVSCTGSEFWPAILPRHVS